MKRARVLISVLLLAAMLLSACGHAAGPAQTAPAGSGAAPATLSGVHHGAKLDGAETRKVKAEESDNVFSAKFEGDRVAGTAEAVDGKYRIQTTRTDGEAWHIKLECNYHTVPGRDYRVTYHFTSTAAGKVKFGDFQEFPVKAGENAVTGVLCAKDGVSYMDLQLGMLPAGTVEFSSIVVEELTDKAEYTDAMAADFRFDGSGVASEQHDDGYDQQLKATAEGAALHFGATPSGAEVWKSKLFVHTGVTPENGARYRVTATLTATKPLDFEICYNNADLEKGYAALYGQHLEAEEVRTVEQTFAVPAEGMTPKELVLQFALGKAAAYSDVTVSAVTVEKIKDEYRSVLPAGFALDKEVYTGKTNYTATPKNQTDVPLPNLSYNGTDTVNEKHDDGYVVSLEESASSATLKITQAPENLTDRGVWKAKLYAATGVTPEAGTTYRVRFDLASTGNQALYEACFDGDYENAYGVLYDRHLTAGGTDHVEMIFTPDVSHGPLTIRLQMGQTDTAAGNTVTLSGLTVEKLTSPWQEVGAANYGSASSADFWAEHAYTGAGGASLTKDGGSASLEIKAPPASGRESWKVKLFVNDVASLTGGKQYRITADVVSTAELDYEICYNDAPNGGGEKAVGALYGLHASPAGQTVTLDVTPGSDASLSLQLNLGLAAEPCTVTVSNVQVRELTSSSDVTVTVGGYPVSTHHDAVYTDKPVTLSLRELMSYDESAATSDMSSSSATVIITKPHNSELGGSGVWSTGIKVNTGVTPETGKTYRLTASTITEGDPQLYNFVLQNAAGGDAYEGRWNSSGSQNFSIDFTVSRPADQCGELVLALELGNANATEEAPTRVTLTGVQVQELTAEAYDETGASAFHVVPGEDPSHKATLTGSGSSATATVNASALTDDWKLKLYANTNTQLTEGKQYRIDMNVSGSGWTVDYKRTDGVDENEFNGQITASGAAVSNTVTPNVTGNLEIVLKIGKVPVGQSVTVSGIKITELGSESLGDNIASAALTSVDYWTHEAYGKGDAGTLTASGSTASLEIKAPPADGREAWKVKLFLNTGIALTAGKQYRITADVSSTAELDGEICYTNGVSDAPENQVAPTKNVHFTSDPINVVCDAVPTAGATLQLQLNLGNASAPCTVTVSNLKVEESLGESAENVLPSFNYNSVGSVSNNADSGYVVSLDKGASSATITISEAPADRNPWNVKLNVLTGFTPKKDQAYIVSFDLESAKPQGTFEVFYDGESEAAYGQLTGQSLTAGKKTFTYTIPAGDSKGVLSLQLRLGKTDGVDGNTCTVSNVKIQSVDFTYTPVAGTAEVASLWHHEAYSASLSKTAKQAKVNISKIPANGMEPWKTKLFIDTGVTLREGVKYRISFDVTADKQTDFEVCLNREGEEKGFGAMYGLTAYPETRTIEYTAYAGRDTYLILQLSLGGVAAPNGVTVSNVKVERAGATEPLSKVEYTF